MTQFPVSASSEQSIYGALELSKNSWLLAIQVPGRGRRSPPRPRVLQENRLNCLLGQLIPVPHDPNLRSLE